MGARDRMNGSLGFFTSRRTYEPIADRWHIDGKLTVPPSRYYRSVSSISARCKFVRASLISIPSVLRVTAVVSEFFNKPS
jgi:hypothetical protein